MIEHVDILAGRQLMLSFADYYLKLHLVCFLMGPALIKGSYKPEGVQRSRSRQNES